MSDEVRSADPGARRKVLVVAMMATLVGGAILYRVEDAVSTLQESARENPEESIETLRWWLRALAFAYAIPLVALGVWTQRLARGVFAEGQYPPSALPVLRTVRVRRGESARRYGRALRVASAVLILMGVAMGVAISIVAESSLLLDPASGSPSPGSGRQPASDRASTSGVDSSPVLAVSIGSVGGWSP